MSNSAILFWGTGALFVAFIAAVIVWALWTARSIDRLLRLVDWSGFRQFWRIMKPEPPFEPAAIACIGLSLVLLLCVVIWAGMRVHHVIVTLAAPDLMKLR